MATSWTGGQYSIFRVCLGLYLFVHFAHLSFWGAEIFSNVGMLAVAEDSPIFGVIPSIFQISDSAFTVTFVLCVAILLSTLLTIGYVDKTAAFLLWLILAWLLGRNPLISNPSMPYVGWMLLMHVFTPTKPFGSLAHILSGKLNVNWRLPVPLYVAAWTILALSYSYSGYTKLISPAWVSGDTISYVLDNPLARDTWLRDWLVTLPPVIFKILTWAVLYIELLFLPLILIKKLRWVMWLLMLLIQLGFLTLLNFADLTFGMLLFHLVTFNPAWLKSKVPAEECTLFYDGTCAMCHGVVRFVAAEDIQRSIRFASLDSDTYQESSLDEQLGGDTIVFIDSSGQRYVRYRAVLGVLKTLGGLYRAASLVMALIPTAIGDILYNFVGRHRKRLFGTVDTTGSVCPLPEPSIAERHI